jgi:hypothetical protein
MHPVPPSRFPFHNSIILTPNFLCLFLLPFEMLLRPYPQLRWIDILLDRCQCLELPTRKLLASVAILEVKSLRYVSCALTRAKEPLVEPFGLLAREGHWEYVRFGVHERGVFGAGKGGCTG